MWPFTRKKKENKTEHNAQNPQVKPESKDDGKAAQVCPKCAQKNNNKAVTEKSTCTKSEKSATSVNKNAAAASNKKCAKDTKIENENADKNIKTSNAKEKAQEPKTAKSKKAIYRVVYDKDAKLWLIKKDGAKRTIASFATKKEALDRVEGLSQSQELNFVVHKKDGKFQKK